MPQNELNPDFIAYLGSEMEKRGVNILLGNNLNNPENAMHSWNLMKYYLNNGTNAYTYYNASLLENNDDREQMHNSLIIVNDTTRTFKYTPKAYALKHVSHYVQSGAKRLQLKGNYNDALAFVNEDGSVVVITANQTNDSYRITIQFGEQIYNLPTEAHSIQTILFKKE